MFCGILEIVIIDTAHGTPRHGVSRFLAVCIGHDVIEKDDITGEEKISVKFTSEFNMHNKWSKCMLDYKESIIGYLHVKTLKDTFMVQNQIVTLVAPEHDEIKQALDEKRDIKGIAVMEFTENFNANPINISYHILHKGPRHYIEKISFTIPKKKLTETQKILHELSIARVEEI